MKRFLELEMVLYTGDKYRRYMNDKLREEDGEMEDWKRAAMGSPEPPPPILGRLRIDPYLISSYSDAFSLEEATSNPDNPLLDCTEICLKSGEMYTAAVSLMEFEKRLEAFYSQQNEGIENGMAKGTITTI